MQAPNPQAQSMHPFQAVQILDEATAGMNGTRESHATIMLAVQVLRAFIAQHSKPVGNGPVAETPNVKAPATAAAPLPEGSKPEVK